MSEDVKVKGIAKLVEPKDLDGMFGTIYVSEEHVKDMEYMRIVYFNSGNVNYVIHTEIFEAEDPTPCCYQHGVGALSTTEPCPEIADND